MVFSESQSKAYFVIQPHCPDPGDHYCIFSELVWYVCKHYRVEIAKKWLFFLLKKQYSNFLILNMGHKVGLFERLLVAFFATQKHFYLFRASCL